MGLSKAADVEFPKIVFRVFLVDFAEIREKEIFLDCCEAELRLDFNQISKNIFP